MKIEEAIQKGIQKNRTAIKQKNYRILEKPENIYTPTIVYQLMSIFCKESGIPLYTRMTKKIRGQMRNWIKDCQIKGIDIKIRLKQICLYWPCLSTITDFSGKRLTVGHTVNFEDYYRNQQYIDPWLDVNGNDLE